MTHIRAYDVSITQEEIEEISASPELYAYCGKAMHSLHETLFILYHDMLKHNVAHDHVALLCEYIAKDKQAAPISIIQNGLSEAAIYLYNLKQLDNDELMRLRTIVEQYYSHFARGTFDLHFEDENIGLKRGSKIKIRCSVDVKRKLLAGCLGVRGNTCIGGDLTVNGNETIQGTLTLLDTPPASVGDFLLTINNDGVVTRSTTFIPGGGFIINGCQPGPLTIGTSDSTTLTFVTECTDRMSINANGAVTIQTPEAGEIGLTIVGGGEEITAGDLNIVAGNIILPAATPGVATSASNGLIEFGGANPSTTNVSEFNVGTRNFFEGNYATVPNVSGTDNIAFGSNANSTLTTANNTIVIGTSSLATATDSIAIGDGINSIVGRTIIIGSRDSTSTGLAPTATGLNSISIGSASGTLIGARASFNAIAIGGSGGVFSGAFASSSRTIAIGVGPVAGNDAIIAIGSASGVAGGLGPSGAERTAISIGSAQGTQRGPNALNTSCIAIGGADGVFPGANASGMRSIAIGLNATTVGTGATNAITIGSASGVAGGIGSTASGVNSLAIGSAQGTQRGANATSTATITIGGSDGIVPGASSTTARSVAIGTGATLAVADRILLGNAASTAVAVGIGTSTPGAKLDVVGANGVIVTRLNQVATAIGNAPQWLNPSTSAVAGTPIHYNASNQLFGFTSSKRYKSNIKSIENESTILYQLHPVLYDSKIEYGNGKNIAGFIAEDVYQIAPNLVILNNENQPENVAYNSLHALAIREIQKHKKQLNEQHNKIQKHKKTLNKIKNMSEKLRRKIELFFNNKE